MWEDLVYLLRSNDGVIVDEFHLPPEFGGAVELHKRVLAREAFDALHFEWQTYRCLISSKLAIILEEGEASKTDCYLADIQKIGSFRREFDRALCDFDVLITPSSAGNSSADRRRNRRFNFQSALELVRRPSYERPWATR